MTIITAREAADRLGEYPELPDCGYAKSGDIKAFGTYTAVQMHAYADATCAARDAAQAQDARQPLTDAEVSSVYFEVLGTVRIQDPTLINRLVRAIEAAHGIK